MEAGRRTAPRPPALCEHGSTAQPPGRREIPGQKRYQPGQSALPGVPASRSPCPDPPPGRWRGLPLRSRARLGLVGHRHCEERRMNPSIRAAMSTRSAASVFAVDRLLNMISTSTPANRLDVVPWNGSTFTLYDPPKGPTILILTNYVSD